MRDKGRLREGTGGLDRQPGYSSFLFIASKGWVSHSRPAPGSHPPIEHPCLHSLRGAAPCDHAPREDFGAGGLGVHGAIPGLQPLPLGRVTGMTWGGRSLPSPSLTGDLGEAQIRNN